MITKISPIKSTKTGKTRQNQKKIRPLKDLLDMNTDQNFNYKVDFIGNLDID